ncbi:hypothetical protein [Treponema zioleckii]|uniref:hypothetical protein n=1 Tax=Treponema zioleckii TaxID=331680 RepID=UPI00168B4EBF|nr:hypothetical protein [Treponema zioleckii]
MKKIIVLIALLSFFGMSGFSEQKSKKIFIDNLYTVELYYDFDAGNLKLMLFSDNQSPFDEQYAEDNIAEVINDFLNDNDLESVNLENSSRDRNFLGRYTVVERIYTIKKQ